MSAEEKWVTTTEAFVEAVENLSVRRVVISGQLSNAPSPRSLAGHRFDK
jgi:hypothetical protein